MSKGTRSLSDFYEDRCLYFVKKIFSFLLSLSSRPSGKRYFDEIPRLVQRLFICKGREPFHPKHRKRKNREKLMFTDNHIKTLTKGLIKTSKPRILNRRSGVYRSKLIFVDTSVGGP